MRFLYLMLVMVLFSCGGSDDKVEINSKNLNEASPYVERSEIEEKTPSFQEKLDSLKGELQAFFEFKVPGERYVLDNIELYSSEVLPRAYINKTFSPIWINDEENAIEKIEDFIAYLDNLNYHGLDKKDYHCEKIVENFNQLKEDGLSTCDLPHLLKLEVFLSDAFLLLASHLYNGKFDPSELEVQYGIQRGKPELNLDQKLYKALNAESFESYMTVFYPQSHGYQKMVEKAVLFDSIKEKDEQIQLPRNYNFSSLKEDTVILEAIYGKLNLLGYVEQGFETFIADTSVYHDKIRSFQKYHGLNIDGEIGSLTFEAINTPISHRLSQLYINMERLRWLPEKEDEYRVVVNIADYTLDLIDGADTIISMRTIVGRNFRQTPVFDSKMTYLVFSPTWTVPPGILRNDVLPAIKKDRGYLAKNNMVVLDRSGGRVDASSIDWKNISGSNFPYIIRQMPGPNNALGRVKFMFPNSYSVYLHDTPSRNLFARDERTFSSGCIRIEKPLELAKILLDDSSSWNMERVKAATNLDRERTVLLKRPVKVYLYYLTAWGGENFRKDIYGRDERKIKWFDL